MNISLTRIQFFSLLFSIFTGFIYIAFQTSVISYGKRASWLMFIAISVLVFLLFIFYEKTYKYFILGKITSFIYVAYWLSHLALLVAYTIYVISTWMMPTTPNYVLLLMLLIPSLYASLSRPETAVNIGGIFSIFILVFIFFMLNASKDFVVGNLFPIRESGMNAWIWGSLHSFTAYANMECYLLFRRFVMKNKKVAGWPLFLFFWGMFLMYFFSIVVVMMYFSLEEFKLISEPILYLLHSQEVTFAKRLDLIFVFIWILISIITMINFILVIRIVRFKKQTKPLYKKIEIIFYHVLIFVVAYFLAIFEVIEMARKYYWISFFIFGVLLPVLIIIWNKVRGRTISDSSN